MQSTDIASILNKLQQSPDNSAEFGEDWSQGRSAFGGLASAFAVTAMRKQLATPQPMRSLMVSFIAPISPGEITVVARIQRQGKNVTQMSADVMSGGQIGLQAMGVFGNSRTALNVPPVQDEAPTPRDQGIQFATHAERLPRFLSYFEGSWVNDGMPYSGTKRKHLQMWVRHKTNVSEFPTEKMVAICDMPPPVILSWFDTPPVPASSLSWALEFVVPPETVTGEWFYLDYSVEAAADGYTQQSGKIYDEEGRLCALSRQCMVYFG